MGMHADEKSDGCMVPMKPRTKPSDIGGGDGGGTAAGQGKGELQRMLRTQRWNRHVTEAASPRIGAVWVPNTPNTDHVRPETGARCGKAARRDLRGGRLATAVPTATVDFINIAPLKRTQNPDPKIKLRSHVFAARKRQAEMGR